MLSSLCRRATGRRWLGWFLVLFLTAAPLAAQAKEHGDQPPAPPTQEELIALAKVSQEEAMAIARQAFNIPEDAEPMAARIERMGLPEDLIWHLDWTLGGTPARTLRVGVDAMTGRIRWMNLEDPQLWGPAPFEAKVTREQAQAMAKALLERVAPEEVGAVQLEPQNEPAPGAEPPRVHWFTWVRTVNGIPFPEQNLSVSISARDGAVVNYSRNWNERVTFAAATDLLSADQAWEKLHTAVAPQLIYRRIGDGAAATYRLFYRAEPAGRVDARTGEIYTPNPPYLQIGEPITPGEVEPPPRQPIATATEATDLARRMLGLGPEVKPVGTNQWGGDPYNPDRFWAVEFQLPGPTLESFRHASVTFNAATGRLQNLWSGEEISPEDQEPVVDEAQAKEIALRFVRTYFAPELPEMVMVITPGKAYVDSGSEGKSREKTVNYNITFNRIVNGVLVEGESINVVISAFSGRIQNVYTNWGTQPLPKPENVLPLDEARAIWWDRFEVRLIYSSNPAYEYTPRDPETVPEAVPVWQLGYRPGHLLVAPTPYVDAISGRFVDWQGMEVVDPSRPPEDMVEHPQREALEAMVAKRALEPRDGKLRPDAPLTRLEAVVLLNRGLPNLASNPYWEKAMPPSPYADILPGHPQQWEVHQAINRGILPVPQPGESLNPDSPVTRGEFAQMLARGMGLGLVERVDRPLPLGFTDADQMALPLRNLMALLAGLGVIDDSQGAFQPDQSITRAEAAVMVQATFKLQPEPSPLPSK